jgi:hypothetical protein
MKDSLRNLPLSNENDFINWSLNQRKIFLPSKFTIDWRGTLLVLIISGFGRLKFL